MRALHRKLREIKLRAVNTEVAVVEQRKQHGVFQAQPQFAIDNEFVHAAWALHLRGGRGSMKKIAGGRLVGRELRAGAEPGKQQQSWNTFTNQHGFAN